MSQKLKGIWTDREQLELDTLLDSSWEATKKNRQAWPDLARLVSLVLTALPVVQRCKLFSILTSVYKEIQGQSISKQGKIFLSASTIQQAFEYDDALIKLIAPSIMELTWTSLKEYASLIRALPQGKLSQVIDSRFAHLSSSFEDLEPLTRDLLDHLSLSTVERMIEMINRALRRSNSNLIKIIALCTQDNEKPLVQLRPILTDALLDIALKVLTTQAEVVGLLFHLVGKEPDINPSEEISTFMHRLLNEIVKNGDEEGATVFFQEILRYPQWLKLPFCEKIIELWECIRNRAVRGSILCRFAAKDLPSECIYFVQRKTTSSYLLALALCYHNIGKDTFSESLKEWAEDLTSLIKDSMQKGNVIVSESSRFIAGFFLLNQLSADSLDVLKLCRLLLQEPFSRKMFVQETLNSFEASLLLEGVSRWTAQCWELFRPVEKGLFSLLVAQLGLRMELNIWHSINSYTFRALLRGLSMILFAASAEPRLKIKRVPHVLRKLLKLTSSRLVEFDASAALRLIHLLQYLDSKFSLRDLQCIINTNSKAGLDLRISGSYNYLFIGYSHTSVSLAAAILLDEHLQQKLPLLFNKNLAHFTAPKIALQVYLQSQNTDWRNFLLSLDIEALSMADFDVGPRRFTGLDNFFDLLEAPAMDKGEAALEEIALGRQRSKALEAYGEVIEHFRVAWDKILECPLCLTEAGKRCAILCLDKISENISEMEVENAQLFRKIYTTLFKAAFGSVSLPHAKFSVTAFAVLANDFSSGAVDGFEALVPMLNCEALRNATSLAPILRRFLDYAVSANVEISVRRRLFQLSDELTTGRERLSLLSAIAQRLNHLHFSEAFNRLRTLLEELCAVFENAIDLVLQPLLLLEDFAVKEVLEALIQTVEGGLAETQRVEPLQKLKLLIVCEGEEPKLADLARRLINVPFLRFSAETPFELRALAATVDSQLLPAVSTAFYKIVSLAGEDRPALLRRFVSEFCAVGVESSSDFPLFLQTVKVIAPMMGEINYRQLLLAVFNAEMFCPQLAIEAAEQVAASLVNHKDAVLDICLDAISTNQGSLSPISVLSLYSQQGDKNARVAPILLSLLKKKDFDFHATLAHSLRRLTSYFGDVSHQICSLLDNARTVDPPATANHCLFAVGLTRGIGIEHIYALRFFEEVEKICLSSKKKDLKDVDARLRRFAVLLIQSLWTVFGRLIEPESRRIFELLLPLAGDALPEIRMIAQNTAESMMQKLSEYSLKEAIPVLLRGCQEKNSKTRLNALVLLGAVSKCGVRQMSVNLPLVVPVLTGIMNDPDDSIRAAAVNSLTQILSTIRNPEISDMRNDIIQALGDPFTRNLHGLDVLLHATFHHYIDSASLSLVLPIVLYGLRPSANGAEKEKACRVAASLAGMIQNEETLAAHFGNLVDALFVPLRDVQPDLRAVAAKVFRTLCSRFPSTVAKTITCRLQHVIEDESIHSTERAGAAQAFAEVLATLPTSQQAMEIPAAISLAADPRLHVREGYITALIYLPIVFATAFQPWVSTAVEQLMESIGHEKERIRNPAIRALKVLTLQFVHSHTSLIAGPLCEGVVAPNASRRQAALILLGDVIEALRAGFGSSEELFERHPALFAALYIGKNDRDSEARLVAYNVFKTFINNVQKSLRCVWPGMVQTFLSLLDQREENVHEHVAGAMQEFSQKYGEVFMREILAFLSAEMEKRPAQSPMQLANLLMKNFSQVALNAERQSMFAEFFESFHHNAHALIRQLALNGSRLLVERSGDWRRAKAQTIKAAERLNTHGGEEDMELLLEFIGSSNERVAAAAVQAALTQPVSEWKLDFIFQRRWIFSALLYSIPELQNGLAAFIDRLLSLPEGPLRDNMATTLAELCVACDAKKAAVALVDLGLALRGVSEQPKEIALLLRVCVGFIEKSPPALLPLATPLIRFCLELVALEGHGAEQVHSLAARFLSHCFEMVEEERLDGFMREVHTTLRATINEKRRFEGLAADELLSSLVGLCLRALLACNDEVGLLALKCLKFLVKHVDSPLFLQRSQTLMVQLLRKLLHGLCSDVLALKIMHILRLLLSVGVHCPAHRLKICQLLACRLAAWKDKGALGSEATEVLRLMNGAEADAYLATSLHWSARPLPHF